MSWIATGVMAAGSIYGSIQANKTASQNASLAAAQSTKEAQANAQSLLTNYKVTTNSILQQANEIQRQAGMELTQAKLEGLKNEATTSAVVADRGFVGSTAARLNESTAINTELLSDQIRQKADSNMVDIMNKLSESKYNYESGTMSNAINASSAATQIQMSLNANTKSTLGIVAGGIASGAQGYALGKQIFK